MARIPKLNSSYWVLMLLCTTMGELIGNLISRNFQLGYALGAFIDVCVFAIAISAVLFLATEGALFYWALILIGNIGGTNLADWVTLEPLDNDKKWGILKPLELGTKMGSLAVMMALLFLLIVRGLIVRTRPGAAKVISFLYWAAILISSTFGTTSGDLITNDTPLGALWGSVALLLVLAVVFAAYKTRRLSINSAYWLSLVLMHPVGATIGNWVSKPIGLNLGNVYTNLFMIAAFAGIYLADTRKQSTLAESASSMS